MNLSTGPGIRWENAENVTIFGLFPSFLQIFPSVAVSVVFKGIPVISEKSAWYLLWIMSCVLMMCSGSVMQAGRARRWSGGFAGGREGGAPGQSHTQL